MPIARFEMPDGRIARFEVPDGTSPEQAQSLMQSHFSANQESATPMPPKPEPVSDSSLVALGAGLGKGVGQVALNVQKYLGKGLDAVGVDSAGQWLASDADQGLKKIEGELAPYKEASPKASGIGEIGGNIAATWPVGGALGAGLKALFPTARAAQVVGDAIATGGFRAGGATGMPAVAARAAGGAINGGASAALVNPEEAKSGAVLGAVLPGVAQGVGKVGGAIGHSFAIGDANRALAQKAVSQYGIPLGVGDIAEGGTLRAVRSILNDAPFSGGIGAAQREATQKGFNKAVGGTFGAPEERLTADVLDAARNRMGSEFDRIWNGNALSYDGQLFNDIQSLRQEAAKLPGDASAHHGGGDAKRLISWLNDIESKMITDQSGSMYMPGDVANRLQSKLRKEAESASGFLKEDLGKLRKALLGAFNRNVSQADAQALSQNMGRYKAFKTLEPLLNSAEAGVAGRMPGDVPAALLPQAVARKYPQAAGAPLTELSQIGSRFLVDRTPKTGGSMRAALQNTALGTALVGGGLTNPLLAAGAIPVASAVNAALGSPAIARRLLANPAQNPAAQAALQQLIQRLSVAAPAGRSVPVLALPQSSGQ